MSKDMLDVTVHQSQGVITDLLQKLGGPNGQQWLAATKRFLRKERVAWNIALWTTVTLGRYKSAQEYDEVLRQLGHLGIPPKDAMYTHDPSGFTCASVETEIDLVRLSFKDLNLSEEAEFADLLREAEALGFKCCPPEVGPALSLVYGQISSRIAFVMVEEWSQREHPWAFHLMPVEKGKTLLQCYRVGQVNGSSDAYFIFVRPRE